MHRARRAGPVRSVVMTPQHDPILLDRSTRFSLRDRLSLSRRLPTPRRSPPGTVGGAWWPRSNDSVAEMADLQSLLGSRAGRVIPVLQRTHRRRTRSR
ncbi:DUF5994 family protein [Nocardia grenadensis]|uniref:DUF5994 family protein n=1 Tax=Nocardia grenadensis TaxID=931537 RepID=UPI003D8E6010